MRQIKTYSEFLNESQSGSHFLKTYEEVQNYLENVMMKSPKRYTINSETLVVDLPEGLIMRGFFEKLPIRFGVCHKDFVLFDCKNLKSLEGFPMRIDGRFEIDGATNLKSLEHFPKVVNGWVTLRKLGIETLEGLNGCEMKNLELRQCHDLRTLLYLPEHDGKPIWSFIDAWNYPTKAKYTKAYQLGKPLTLELHLKSLYYWLAGKGVEFDTVKGFCDRLHRNNRELYFKLAILSKEMAITPKQQKLFDLVDDGLIHVYKQTTDIEKGYF